MYNTNYKYIISDYEIDRLLGEIMETIESIGLPEKQEIPLKNIIRKKITSLYQSKFQLQFNDEISKSPLDEAILVDHTNPLKTEYFRSKLDKNYKPQFTNSAGKII